MMTKQEKKVSLESINERAAELFQVLADFNRNCVREEDYQKLLDKHEELSTQFGEINASLSSLKNWINKNFGSDDLDAAAAKWAETQTNLGNAQSSYEVEHAKYVGKEQEYDELVTEKSDVEGQLNNLKKLLQQKFDFELCENISDYGTKCDKLLGKHESDIKDVKKTVYELTNKFNNLCLEQNGIKNERKEYKEKCDAWGNATEQYKPLLAAMEQCDVVKDLVSGATQPEKLLGIVANIGKGQEFLKDVYELFCQKKKEDKESLSVEEKEFFKAVNSFCREHFLVVFDVFQAPGSDINEFKTVPFDKEKMENVKDKKKDNLKNAVKLCVPMLMSLETGNMYYRALVEASN